MKKGKIKIGCFSVFVLLIAVLFTVMNVRYYFGDDFRIKAFGEKHKGNIIRIDSTASNYNHYNYSYSVRFRNHDKDDSVTIVERARRNSYALNTEISFAKRDLESRFVFSLKDIISQIIFGALFIGAWYLVVKHIA